MKARENLGELVLEGRKLLKGILKKSLIHSLMEMSPS
jgi:hypothetical protein